MQNRTAEQAESCRTDSGRTGRTDRATLPGSLIAAAGIRSRSGDLLPVFAGYIVPGAVKGYNVIKGYTKTTRVPKSPPDAFRHDEKIMILFCNDCGVL